MSEQTTEMTEQGHAAEPATVRSTAERLREAREAAGLSREEVAAKLRLRLELIRALEEEDQAQLPPAAFVSGYLRSYARLLNLPYDEVAAEPEKLRTTPSLVSPVMPPHQRRSGDLPVKAVTYLIILLLLAMLIAWWMSRRPTETQPQAESAAVVAPGSTVELSLPPAGDTSAEPPVTATATAPVTESAPPPAPAELQSELQLEATGADCWIEIKDATGKQVMYDLLKKGSTRTVQGKAPFDVFLGYAPGVTVYYKGQVFDHSRFDHNDMARFHVGQASDNSAAAE